MKLILRVVSIVLLCYKFFIDDTRTQKLFATNDSACSYCVFTPSIIIYSFERLCISYKLEFCIIGATPLRICGDNAIVVVKCPKKEYGKSMKDAMKTISFFTGTYSNRRINKKSHWFFEVQGQLHIANKQMAYLVIYLGGQEYEIIEIERNDAFWKKEMEEELCYFYNEALLKELINPRDERGMELRQYNSEKVIFE